MNIYHTEADLIELFKNDPPQVSHTESTQSSRRTWAITCVAVMTAALGGYLFMMS